jgi:Rieske 2Fe-2S family protein
MWLCVGREEDLPDAGSYLTQAIGSERILVVRGEDRALRAFYNVCRHRGTQLVEEPCGRLRGAIGCPYHAWTYALDGRLLRAPRAEAGFRPEEFPLLQARLETLGGFVFVNLERNAPALGQALADLPDLGRYRLAELRRVRIIEYTIEANWKVIAENYSECYHCPLVHPQLSRISDLTSGFAQCGDSFNGGPMQLREGFTTMSMSGATALAPIPGLADRIRRLVHHYLVYPNLMLGLHRGCDARIRRGRSRWTARASSASGCSRASLAAPVRSSRHGGVLGSHQPPGLGAVRARAARRGLGGLRAGALPPDRALRARVRQVVRGSDRAAACRLTPPATS